MARHTFGVARRPPFISVFSLVGLVLPSSVVADNTTDNTTSAFFSPLGDLDTPGPSPRQLLLGQQNFTRCCLQAVQDWRQGGEPDVTILSSRNPTVVFASADQLGTSGEQFPCGATYNGDDRGAPQVLISYDWCTSNCGGWQRSASSVLTQWVQPFVGFILPSVAFCLNVGTPPLISRLPLSSLSWVNNGHGYGSCELRIFLDSTQDGLYARPY